MPKTRWLDNAEKKAWKSFTLMQFQLFALLGRELADTGLSFQDYVVLAELSERPDQRARLTELGRQLGWEKSRISHQVTRMEQRKLVAKIKCPTDQRGWDVTLTETGREALVAAAPHHVDTVRRYFVDRLTKDHIRALEQISDRVLAELPNP